VTAAHRRSAASASHSVDLVLLAPREGVLHVLVQKGVRGAAHLPWASPRAGETLAGAARQLAKRTAGAEPGWLEQLQAFGDQLKHPAGVPVSIAYVGVISGPAADGRLVAGATWVAVAQAGLTGRHGAILEAALDTLRTRLDYAPIAFKLLPPTFTLSELQGMYELLLGWALHKASFRRSLQAAYLVEPTDEWRSEGRGRPAQLYRFAPRKRRQGRRGVRFDVLQH
jgi:8-oxo-dGTP diphosphatase